MIVYLFSYLPPFPTREERSLMDHDKRLHLDHYLNPLVVKRLYYSSNPDRYE